MTTPILHPCLKMSFITDDGSRSVAETLYVYISFDDLAIVYVEGIS